MPILKGRAAMVGFWEKSGLTGPRLSTMTPGMADPHRDVADLIRRGAGRSRAGPATATARTTP
jgi:hypothetical protein